VNAGGIYTSATTNPLAGFEIRFYSFASRATEVLGRVEKPFGRSMSVSPDGRWLLFQDYPARRGDLMLVENFR
jgi:hypothetical protein